MKTAALIPAALVLAVCQETTQPPDIVTARPKRRNSASLFGQRLDEQTRGHEPDQDTVAVVDLAPRRGGEVDARQRTGRKAQARISDQLGGERRPGRLVPDQQDARHPILELPDPLERRIRTRRVQRPLRLDGNLPAPCLGDDLESAARANGR